MEKLKKKLLKKPSLCFLPLIGNLLVGAYLVELGVSIENGFLFEAAAAVFLYFIYKGLKTREMRELTSKYSVHKNPKEFWRTILFCFGYYLLVSIGIPVAIIGRHANGFGWN